MLFGGNVLYNNGSGADSDVDSGDVLSVSEVNGSGADVGVQITLASGALLTVQSDGFVTYNPNGAFEALGAAQSTTDLFGYTISDGHGGDGFHDDNPHDQRP